MSTAKDPVRKQLLDTRDGLSNEEVRLLSECINAHVSSWNLLKQADCILWYVSYGNEVYTHDLIRQCLRERRRVVVPKSIVGEKRLELYVIDSWGDLSVGSYGILEPDIARCRKANPSEINLVMVPGVGFDRNGGRIGHGHGYYDRLLKEMDDVVSVGLCFENQLVDKIPMSDHDVRVWWLVTEQGRIQCI